MENRGREELERGARGGEKEGNERDGRVSREEQGMGEMDWMEKFRSREEMKKTRRRITERRKGSKGREGR